MVINGVLSDATRVSNEVTEEVIVTAVEAGESVRRVVQFLVLLFAAVAGLCLSTLIASICRSTWDAILTGYDKWRCSAYWWQRGRPAIRQSRDEDEQECSETRPRMTGQLADQENGDSENPKSPNKEEFGYLVMVES